MLRPASDSMPSCHKSSGDAKKTHQQCIAIGLLDDAADARHMLSSVSEHHKVQAALVLQQKHSTAQIKLALSG